MIPVYQKDDISSKQLFHAAVRMLRQKGYLQLEDRIAYLSGNLGKGRGTDLLQINKVEDVFSHEEQEN